MASAKKNFLDETGIMKNETWAEMACPVRNS